MKVKIERVPYPSFRNDEFPTVYGQTIHICEKHDMRRLYLEKTYDELISFRPTIESLTVYLRKNAKLAHIGSLDVERDKYTQTLNKIVRDFEQASTYLPEFHPHYEILEALLAKHNTKTIAAASRAAETERLLRLEADVRADSTIQTAFDVFGLTPVIKRLFEANHEYEDCFEQYIAEKSEEQRIDVSLLRRECSKALVQFFDAVQYSAFIYEDIDYMPLINELIKLNQYYIQQLKARATRRQNGKKTNEEPPIPPMQD
jgi:hypothetical protein